MAAKKKTEETKTAEPTLLEQIVALGVAEDIATKIVDELGVTSVADLAMLTESDLTDVGMKAIPARKLLAAVKVPEPEPAPAAGPRDHAAEVSAVSIDSLLPAVPSNESWLMALRSGGVLKVDQSTVIAAIRAAMANRAGLFQAPERLVQAMEAFTDESEEQVPPEFFALRKLLTRRSYGDLFDAIDGMDGNFVTKARKDVLLRRLDDELWPAILTFHETLKGWQEAWMQGTSNPNMMMMMMMGKGTGMTMPPGVMSPPDTGVVRDAGDAVADAVNRVFKGTGVQIASALAYEATQISETLTNPRLPAMVGAASREIMLKKLGLVVPATYPRLEQNLVRYVLGILEGKERSDDEVQYFGALFMLGSQITWSELDAGSNGVGRLSGIGSQERRPIR
ncbi:MAG: hypothetical protein HQ488_02275 [Parcubacteria group bacterium]|nr:hypothetical protein [Parcubacteria group bacterium]